MLDGEIRSAFCMTEPGVASSDATNIATRIVRDGDEYVINGTKWWSSGAADPRCQLLIVMGKTDPDGRDPPAAVDDHRRRRTRPASRSSAPTRSSAGRTSTATASWSSTDVRVPAANILGEEGGGFAAAQARLGPGRIHHVMRALGAGERALAMMVSRTQERVAFGKPLADQSSVRERIAESRIELEQARALCHRAAYVVDSEGNKEARHLIAAAKVAVPRAVNNVIDRAIQVHGAAGISDATPLSMMYGWHRAMRIFDGPDEVHLTSLAGELGPPCSTCPDGGTLDGAPDPVEYAGGDAAFLALAAHHQRCLDDPS